LVGGFSTFIAPVWLLSCVNQLMSSEHSHIAEGFLAFKTHKGLLSCMCSLVYNKHCVMY
jgi:hypothetical protein